MSTAVTYEQASAHVGDFVTMEMEPEVGGNFVQNTTNPYINQLVTGSNLLLLLEGRIKVAFQDSKELNLFSLFITKQHVNLICQWTNQHLLAKYNFEVNKEKFQMYLGLEMAMSIAGYKSIREYWSLDLFLGHPNFQKVMGRDKFMKICASLVFCVRQDIIPEEKTKDPLWHSWEMLAVVLQNFANIAIPIDDRQLTNPPHLQKQGQK